MLAYLLPDTDSDTSMGLGMGIIILYNIYVIECEPQCGPQNSSLSITWELVREVEAHAALHTY